MKDLKKINRLRKAGLLLSDDRIYIWNLYQETFNTQPNGKITCGYCMATATQDLYKHFLLIHLTDDNQSR